MIMRASVSVACSRPAAPQIRCLQRQFISMTSTSPDNSGGSRGNAVVPRAAATAAAGTTTAAALPPAAAAVAGPSLSASATTSTIAGNNSSSTRHHGRPPRRAVATEAGGPPGGGGGAGRRQMSTGGGAGPKAAATAAKVSPDTPWLIVGLGNPGPRYERTRHNVGFMVVDAFARAEGIDMRKLEKSAAFGLGEVGGRKVLLAKPVTFMNNSGESVAALARYYKVPPARLLVVADDLDSPPAAVKLKQRGGHGGHNGLRSIIDRLGGNSDFPRLKIGIGRPTGSMDVASYVLQDFRQSEMADIDAAIADSIRIINSVLALGLDKALSGQRL